MARITTRINTFTTLFMNLIILPVFNEEKTIRKTIDHLYLWCHAYFPLNEFQLVLINDGSTDRTLEICKDFDHGNVLAINNMFDRGKGSALKTAYVLSTQIFNMADNDNIIFLDGDGQINPKEIQVHFNIMKLYNADVVIGNKRHKYSMTKYTATRRLISHTYNKIINIPIAQHQINKHGIYIIF